jgi:hypothetical protein
MRERLACKRFGLVLGAGVSKNLDFPDWKELVGRIARSLAAATLTHKDENALKRSQLLFQHFRRQRKSESEDSDRIEWKKLVHDCLYDPKGRFAKGHVKDSKSIERIKARDKYLGQFLEVIRKCPLTINYNFDDSIQRLLLDRRDTDSPSRGYSTIWASNVQLPACGGLIYHPNGFLPYELSEQPSDQLAFLQDTFADQLIDSIQGRYALLTNHLSQTTCLLIGLSIDDPTLRHVLRHSAQLYPGHVHYFVRYVEAGRMPNDERRDAEFDANFGVYNLLTLNLTDAELSALGRLISLSPDEFEAYVRECKVKSTFTFYLAGAVGVGKTTALRHLQSLRAHEEWPDPLPREMTVSPKTLRTEDLEMIDRWVDGQLYKKNQRLLLAGCGVDIVDRAPLDAFAFVDRSHWPKRAEEIIRAVQGDIGMGRRLCDGHIVLLIGDPVQIEAQARRVFRDPTREGVEHQQRVLQEIYAGHPGVTLIDTVGLSPGEVARRIASTVHTKEYTAFPLHDRLVELRNGGLTAG